jgi:signal peptidase I
VTGVGRHTEEERRASVQQPETEQQQVREATQTAKEQRASEKPSHIILAFIIKIGVVCLAIWLIFTFVFGIHLMHGESMYPKLRDGDLIFYSRMEKDYYIGDVVVFKVNNDTRVARIVAQGGDVVEVNEDGQLLVNGDVQQEEIFYPTEPEILGVKYPYTVEEGSYFMLCDYRTISEDSRYYGAVSQEDFYGKVITLLRRREF